MHKAFNTSFGCSSSTPNDVARCDRTLWTVHSCTGGVEKAQLSSPPLAERSNKS